MGLSNFRGAPKPPRRGPGEEELDPHRREPLHSLEPNAELAAKWALVLVRLKAAAPPFTWEIWLQHGAVVHEQGSTLYVELPSSIFEHVSNRYDGHYLMAAREELGDKVSIEYVRHGWRPEGAPPEETAGEREAAKLKNEPPPPAPLSWEEPRPSRTAPEFTAEVETAALQGRRRSEPDEIAYPPAEFGSVEAEIADRRRQEVAEAATALTPEQADKLADDIEGVLERGVDETVPKKEPNPAPSGKTRRRSDVPPRP